PYDAAYSASTCNGLEYGAGATVAESSAADCVGGFVGLVNMSGNVAEWENACSGQNGASDACATRGGSFESDAGGLRCDSAQSSGPITQARSYSGPDVGFRCCL